MPNLKIKRLNHTIQEVVSEIIMTEVKNEEIKFVTITGVDTTNDLSFSKIYYTVLNDEKKDIIKEALEKASPFIRTKLAEKIEVRHTPELKFIYDTSIAYGEHIDKLIKEINEK